MIKATGSLVFVVGSFPIHFNTDVHNLLCRLALITIVGPIILKSLFHNWNMLANIDWHNYECHLELICKFMEMI